MQPDESLIHSCCTAIGDGDASALLPLLAEHSIFHFPGHSRFAGDYTGKATIAAFWTSFRQQLSGEPVRIHLQEVRATREQVIALVSMSAQRRGAPSTWHGTFLFFVHNAQIAEWWYQLDDERAFDTFWAYSPTPLS